MIQKPLISFKGCTRCKKTKPATTDYFYRDRTANRFSSWCCECHRKRTRENDYKRRSIAKGIAPEGFKKCSKCNEIKPETNVFFAKNGDKLKSYCKKCGREYAKEYSARNRFNMKRSEKSKEKERNSIIIKSLFYAILSWIIIYLLLFK